eukprot:8835209-Lingulodinium_polyedra.AAC.1
MEDQLRNALSCHAGGRVAQDAATARARRARLGEAGAWSDSNFPGGPCFRRPKGKSNTNGL